MNWKERAEILLHENAPHPIPPKPTKPPFGSLGSTKGGTFPVVKNDMAPIKKSRPPESAEEVVSRTDMNRMAPHEAFAYALEEIKQMIKAEFKSLRAELKLWREGQ